MLLYNIYLFTLEADRRMRTQSHGAVRGRALANPLNLKNTLQVQGFEKGERLRWLLWQAMPRPLALSARAHAPNWFGAKAVFDCVCVSALGSL